MITCFPKSKLGFGPKVQEFENAFAKISKKKYNIGVNSASSASFMIFDYLYKIHGPCNVFMSSLGFTSSAWAAKKIGHHLFFVDVDKKLMFDFNFYKKYFRKLIKLGAIKYEPVVLMPVLYGGDSTIYGWDIENEIVITDCAHILTCDLPSDFTFYSFHPQKCIKMLTGGIICTDNEAAADFFYKYRNFGRENVGDSYTITQDGFKFFMDEPNASMGLRSLRTAYKDIEKRKRNYHQLCRGIVLSPLIERIIYHDDPSSYYLLTIILKPSYSSRIIRGMLVDQNVQSTFLYPFLHTQSYYYNKQQKSLSYLEGLIDRIINLPIHEQLTQNNIKSIINVWTNIEKVY